MGTLVMGRRLNEGCLICLAVSMVSGAVVSSQKQVVRPDTHTMAAYIKRLMKRDGQQDWANEVLDWDKRNTFDLKRLMKRDSYLEDSNGQVSPMKRDFDGFAPQRLMKKDLEGFAPQRLMKKDIQGFAPERLMKKDLDSFGPRRLMKKNAHDQNGFSTRRLMKRHFEAMQAFGPRRLMKKDFDGFNVQRLMKKDFDPKRLMKKELWSTRIIQRGDERPEAISWKILDLPTDSEVWEPIAEVQEPHQGNWRIEW